jgi:hypothetical protein
VDVWKWYHPVVRAHPQGRIERPGHPPIGLFPDGSFVSRAIGNSFSYRGIVADQFGNKILGAVSMSTGIGSTGLGANDTSGLGGLQTATGFASIGLQLAIGNTPAGQVLAGVQVGFDVIRMAQKIAKCN